MRTKKWKKIIDGPIESWASFSKCCNLRINCRLVLDRERAIVREVIVCVCVGRGRGEPAFLVIAVTVLQFCNSFDLFPLSLGSRPSERAAERTNMSRSPLTALRSARTRTALPRKVDHRLLPRPTLAFSGLANPVHTHPHVSAR